MAQFDLYPNPNRSVAGDLPYIIDLQADFLRDLPTRVVAPLARPESITPSPHLDPWVEVEGERLALLTHHLVSLPTTILGAPLGSLADRRLDIIAALDFLFTGI